jgi:putative CocE/NonD family hydrolase
MRDGTTLFANVYRPAVEGSYPVLLTRLPYGKDTAFDPSYFDPVRAAREGYVVVVQDVRGRFRSEGDFTPFVHEYDDGYDTVEWAAGLAGSDGRVGMWGMSYFGKTQWQAAVMEPPSLASMVPGITWGNHLNGAQMRGGVLELGAILYWAETVLALEVLFRRHREEPEVLQERMPALVRRIDTILAGGGYDALPLSDLPVSHDLVPFVKGGLGHDLDDPTWEYLNIDGKYDRVSVPTLHVGGWYDVFIGETLRQYAEMKRVATERGFRAPRLLVGPWTHGMYGNTVGELDFGIGASGRFLDYRGDLTDRQLAFFDATLKGDEDALAATPPVEVFVMGENRWRGYEEWPPPGAREERWHLRAGGRLAREAPDAGEPPDEYDYDPLDPVPTVGGALLMPPIHGPGPRDQRQIESRPDVLIYTSEPLESPYTVIGPVHVRLHAASSAPDTDFVARLVDVYPDGRAIVVTDGIIRASARESYPAPGVLEPVAPSPIEPEEVYEYVVDLWGTGISFLPSHRIRLHVASSSFPRWARNPNTGESPVDSAETETARQSIFHDPEHPSYLSLTVVEG